MNVGELRSLLAEYDANMQVLVLADGNIPLRDGNTYYPPQALFPTGAFCLFADTKSRPYMLDADEISLIETRRESFEEHKP